MKHIYIDESRISKSRFQLFGSFWIDRNKLADFENKYWKLWDEEFPSRRSELHWVKVSKGKLETYKKFINFFATYPGVDFRCVLIDTRTLDYKKYHNGDKELGFYKFLYFFISRNIEKDFKFKGVDDKYQLILDRRRRKSGDEIEVGRLNDLKLFLNNRIKRFYQQSEISIRSVEAINSKESPAIQITDILMGAVGYSWEGYQTSPAKLELIEYIESVFGLKLKYPTPYLADKINIWNFELNEKKKRPTPYSLAG